MLDCIFSISDMSGETKLLALINSSALFIFMSYFVAKHLSWEKKPNNTPVIVN